MATDLALACRNHLQGKCTKGDQCKYHHSEPRRFHESGICKLGSECPFPHVELAAAAASQEDAPTPKAKAKAKAKATAGGPAAGQDGALDS